MIIVTGAAGLIGSAVVRELNARGQEQLILVDHLGVGDKWKNLRSLRYADYLEKDEFIFMLDEAVEGSHVSPLLAEATSICHLGANSSTTEQDATHLIENNYRYSQRVAEFALLRRLRCVYASSAATYGDGEQGFDDDPAGLDGLRPLNMYGYSKHMFDLWLRKREFEPGFAGVKYFNVFGPGEYHKGEMMSLVLKAYRQIVETGKLKLFKSYKPEYKDGEQMRDFLYVKDAARMTVHLLLDSDATGLYNAGSGEANTWNELAASIFSAMGRESNIEYVDMPEHLKQKYQYYTCAPIDRLRGAGYEAQVTPLREAVADYVKNYLIPGELNP